MRAWPARPSRLQLTLTSDWYALPWSMPAPEVRRLLELLRAGLDDAEYCVELEWDGLEAMLGRLALARSVVALRVPAEIEPEEVVSAQARIGSVRVGLLLHEQRASSTGAGAVVTRPGASWQLRDVKIPLLAALTREFHEGRHPFAGLGLEQLPLERLGELTDEPIELLELLDATVEHRLRYAALGVKAEDWSRSVVIAVGERLASRLSRLKDARLLSAALELAIEARERALWSGLDHQPAGRALAQLGLAWQDGGDLLISALAREAGDPKVILRLLEGLPAWAWSPKSTDALRAAIPKALPLPPAVEVTPEPNYMGALPFEAEQIMHADLGAQWSLPQPLEQALDGLLEELRNDALLDVDFARGRIYRFAAFDRAVADLPQANWLSAFVRWCGVSQIVRRTHDWSRLDVLAREVEFATELAAGSRRLGPALEVMRGDLWAMRREHHAAIACWMRARATLADEALDLRIAVASLRIHEPFEFCQDLDDDHFWPEANEMKILMGAFAARALEVSEEKDSELESDQPNSERPLIAVCHAAIALEREDWPRVLERLAGLDLQADTPIGLAARLIWAWTRVALGELDLAAFTFDALRVLADARGDKALSKLAAQGYDWTARSITKE